MKRALLFIFMTVCVLGMSACSSKDAMPETSDSASNPVQNTDISNLNGGKIWSEQDIVSMFSLVQETDWEYIDCVLIPDCTLIYFRTEFPLERVHENILQATLLHHLFQCQLLEYKALSHPSDTFQ